MSSKVEIKHYRADGSYRSDIYNKTEYYCPNCGCQGVWVEEDGDFYIGSLGICMSCKKSHHCAADFYDVEDEVYNYIYYISFCT